MTITRLEKQLKVCQVISDEKSDTIRSQNAQIWDLESEVNSLKAQLRQAKRLLDLNQIKTPAKITHEVVLPLTKKLHLERIF